MTAVLIKATLDRVVAAVAVLLALPVMAVIAAAIKAEHPRLPILFVDWCAGKDGAPFRFVKFRTMLPHPIDYGNRPEIHPGNPLVTRVGRWLRRLKLDELPQLVHVLRGDMSLVGPRPMDIHRYQRASDFFKQRCLVPPGLTGMAQVSGNIRLSWDERMEMDVWYIANWSLKLDLEILCRTIGVILFGERVVEDIAAQRRMRDHSVRVTPPGRRR